MDSVKGISIFEYININYITMKEVIDTLSIQRKGLDAIKIAINKLPNSRGKALGFTALEKGRMYIGEVSRELGAEYPYEATKQAVDAKGIQAAVDLADTETPVISITGNEVVDLNTLREVLEKELDYFMGIIFIPKKGLNAKLISIGVDKKFTLDCNISEAYRSLKESRMWLGVRLGELRDTAK